MSFQTRETFVHLQNTNEDISDAFWELSDPPIDSTDPNTIKAQKQSKDIVKIIHVTSGVQEFYEASRILFVHKQYQYNDFSNSSPPRHARMYTDTLFTFRSKDIGCNTNITHTNISDSVCKDLSVKKKKYFCDQSCIFSIITPVFSVTWSSEIIIICWFDLLSVVVPNVFYWKLI